MVSKQGGMLRPHSSKLALVHRVLDCGAILLALELASRFTERGLDSRAFALAGAWAALLYLIIGNARNLYGSWRLQPLRAVLGQSLMTWFWSMLALAALAFMTKTSDDYSRIATFVWFALTPVLLMLERASLRFLVTAFRTQGRNSRTLAIVGKTKIGREIEDKITQTPWLGLRFVGYYDDRAVAREEKDAADVRSVGFFTDLVDRARKGEIDYIYITLPMRAERRIVELVDELSDTTASVFMVPNFFVFDLLHGKWASLDGIPVVSVYDSPFYGVDGWAKRAEDIVVGSLILLLIALPMLVIAAGVKFTSPGPVIFKQRRYGLNGKVVEVWKFRSMGVCENGDNVTQASRNDMRVTPLGAFLRRTSLDELPQFINVLQGNMSIVGPRPHAVAHNEQYRKLIHGYMLRHKVKPGITGWAQINGWRGETDTLDKMAMRVKYDLEYVQNWSIMLDLKIIFMTIFKGFRHANAY
jgi:putative colanic acid biosysnthesis UDP-glucose lipid carrier transferase